MSYETILLEVDAEGIAWLTFNRPEVRNALNLAMVEDVRAALRCLQARDDVKVLILTGAGDKAFLGGADIAELRDRGRSDALRLINTDLFAEIERFAAPTIAAINGFALGGGCEIAMACDLRVCASGAKLGQPEVGLGIIPGAGATYRLPRLVGLGRARELIFTGRIIDSAEALQIGLVNQVVPNGRLLEAARELAQAIAKNSALAVRLAKVAINAQASGGLGAWQALESTAQAVLFDDDEKRARMTAFLDRKQKRKGTQPIVTVVGAGSELSLGFAELHGFPDSERVADVGEVVAGRSGSAVRLSAILARLGEAPAGAHTQVTSADGNFSSSLEPDMAARSLIVYAQDGRPLATDKGGPFRLLIPDPPDPCMNVKGVARLELTTEPGGNACKHTRGEA